MLNPGQARLKNSGCITRVTMVFSEAKTFRRLQRGFRGTSLLLEHCVCDLNRNAHHFAKIFSVVFPYLDDALRHDDAQ